MIVLLIENDDELRNALTLTMEKWGVDVLPCTCQDEAERLLTDIDVAPDAIIADYQLEQGRLGVDAIAAVTGSHGDIPACIITANRSASLDKLCDRLGHLLIHKPIDPGALRGFLAASLR